MSKDGDALRHRLIVWIVVIVGALLLLRYLLPLVIAVDPEVPPTGTPTPVVVAGDATPTVFVFPPAGTATPDPPEPILTPPPSYTPTATPTPTATLTATPEAARTMVQKGP